MDSLARARKALSARIADPKVKLLPGLADDLRAILGAFDECDRRTTLLAAMVLRKHYWPDSRMHADEVRELAAFGAEPATVARQAQHGDRCACSDCMRGK